MPKKQTVKKKPVPAKPAHTPFSKWQLFLMAGAIVIVAWCSFSPALKNDFTNWDDNAYVFENKQLPKPLPETIPYFFGPHYFIGNYHPLTMAIYALEYHAVGLQPELFHTVNILIHLVNVLLVFWFIWLLSGKKPWVAAFVSLFFGIHPMHVESVAWVAELKDVLYCCFFMAGLIAYYQYLENELQDLDKKSNYKFPVAAFGFFILSLLSKPAAVMFPVVLLLVYFYTKRKFDKRVWTEKLPFFILSVVFGIVAVKAQQADRLVHDFYPFSQRIFFASYSFIGYIVKLFLPLSLSNFYPYPHIAGGGLPFIYYAAPIVVILLFYGVYRSLRYSRLIAFGFLFFFVNVVLVLQLLSIGDAMMADRYTYVAYIGLFFIIAMGIDKMYNSAAQNVKPYKAVATTTIILLAMACAYGTYARCEVWKDDDTLANDLLDKFPDDRLALNNKGFLLFWSGKYNESIPLFKKAIRSRPDYIMAYINLANSYIALRDGDSALITIDSALNRAPQDYNLRTTKGMLLFEKHQYPEAMENLKKAISIKKENIDSYKFLALCYYDLKQYNDALKTLDAGLTYDPANYFLLNTEGYILYVEGKYNDAMGYFKASLKTNPNYTTAQANLSNCYKAISDSAKGTE